MTTLMLEAEPIANQVEISDSHLIVALLDGRKLSVPLSWYPRLLHSTVMERENWELFGEGTAIVWPDLDEHIGIEGLLAGRKSAESEKSFDRWLDSRV